MLSIVLILEGGMRSTRDGLWACRHGDDGKRLAGPQSYSEAGDAVPPIALSGTLSLLSVRGQRGTYAQERAHQ